jgi:hypothetical protein
MSPQNVDNHLKDYTTSQFERSGWTISSSRTPDLIIQRFLKICSEGAGGGQTDDTSTLHTKLKRCMRVCTLIAGERTNKSAPNLA